MWGSPPIWTGWTSSVIFPPQSTEGDMMENSHYNWLGKVYLKNLRVILIRRINNCAIHSVNSSGYHIIWDLVQFFTGKQYRLVTCRLDVISLQDNFLLLSPFTFAWVPGLPWKYIYHFLMHRHSTFSSLMSLRYNVIGILFIPKGSSRYFVK